MKIKIKFIMSAFVLSVLLIFLPVSVSAGGEISGSGTEADPYLIEDAADLQYLQASVLMGKSYSGQYFVQTKDIDMSGIDDWETIGCWALKKSFGGVYDGRGFSIKNLKCDEVYSGLFDSLSGIVVNLRVENFSLSGDCCGGIAANVNGGGKIAGCIAAGTFAGEAAGGIAYSNSGIIVNCYSDCVYGNDNYGAFSYAGAGKFISCTSSDQQIKGKNFKGLAFKSSIVDANYFSTQQFVKDYNKNAYDALYFNGTLFHFQIPLEYSGGQVEYSKNSNFSIFSFGTVKALWAYIMFFDVAAAAVIGIIFLTGSGSKEYKTEKTVSKALKNSETDTEETLQKQI